MGEAETPADDVTATAMTIGKEAKNRAMIYALYDTIRYDTRCYFNVRSKADMNWLNLPHGDDN